ncbi:MAG: flap structure-specific endonuclease, partial [Thermoplasmatales archaeon]|nr:flap structure-specific endonuclease [Thermoplasmatales archaeon]
MGVDLGDLFKKEQCTYKDFRDRIIVIDAYNVLHQFLSIIRSRDGTPLKDSHGNITSHLSGLLYRTANLIEAKIRPVYVFDGKPHPLKTRVIEQRKQRRLQAEKAWKEALEKGDIETAKKKAQQTSRVTDEIV